VLACLPVCPLERLLVVSSSLGLTSLTLSPSPSHCAMVSFFRSFLLLLARSQPVVRDSMCVCVCVCVCVHVHVYVYLTMCVHLFMLLMQCVSNQCSPSPSLSLLLLLLPLLLLPSSSFPDSCFPHLTGKRAPTDAAIVFAQVCVCACVCVCSGFVRKTRISRSLFSFSCHVIVSRATLT
jgi:hypothetical protein